MLIQNQKYRILSFIYQKPLWIVLLVLACIYSLINLLFTCMSYFNHILDTDNILNYIYFAFVTATTLGYGDLTPISEPGKLIVIIQVLFSTLYFALMIAILGAKLLSPRKTIIFSDKLLYIKADGKRFGKFIFRFTAVRFTHKTPSNK